ncbi:hypothetical protein D3C86_1668520 [compost metagenome]
MCSRMPMGFSPLSAFGLRAARWDSKAQASRPAARSIKFLPSAAGVAPKAAQMDWKVSAAWGPDRDMTTPPLSDRSATAAQVVGGCSMASRRQAMTWVAASSGRAQCLPP